MKLIGMTALLALAFASCQKPIAKNEEPKLAESTPLPATPIPTPIATPVAMAVATPQPATPAPRLAPEGIYYLIVAVKVETKDGIVGLPPGTGVKLVRPGVYLTPLGEMSLTSAQLTNDMDVAREARDTDHARQGALQKRLADEAAATRTVKAAQNVVPVTPPPPASDSGRPAGALDRATSGLNQTHDATKDHTGVDAQGRTYWIDVFGKHHYK